MTLPLDLFSEQAIYLDTMLPYLLLRGADPAVKSFFSWLERGAFAAYTSALSFDELAYQLILALIKDQCPGCRITEPSAYFATSDDPGCLGV